MMPNSTPEGCKKISRWLASEASVTTGDFGSPILAPRRGAKILIARQKPGVAPLRGLPLANIHAPLRGAAITLLVTAVALISVAVPVLAHHSFAAEFDRSKAVTLTGTVTKVEWANPHARFYIDVKDENGKVNNWDFELASPNGLMRRGWTRNSLKLGDVVTVTGWSAKNAPYVGNASTVTLSGGKKIFAGSSAENETSP